MLAHFRQSLPFPVQLNFHAEMPLGQGDALLGGNDSLLLPVQRPVDLSKQPGISLSPPARHYRVAAGFPQHAHRVRAGKNIAIAEHGDGHRLLHLPDDTPVRLAGVKLIPGAGVDGDSLRPVVLTDFGDFHGVDAVRIPAGADFRRHRQAGSIRRRPHDFPQQGRFPHQGAALPRSGDFRGRAAEIQVNELKPRLRKLRRRSRHVFRFPTEQLQAAVPFPGQSLKQLQGVSIFAPGIDPALGGEHFAYCPAGPHFMAQKPHHRVADPRHGRKSRAAAYLLEFHTSRVRTWGASL